MHNVGGIRRLIGIKDAAGYTGLSVHTVYAMVSQRRIPYVKVYSGSCPNAAQTRQ